MIRPQKHLAPWLICLALALGTLILYWPVRDFDFVDFDDPQYILNEPAVRNGLSWWGLVWSVVDAHASNWHPLTWLSHMLDCQLFGLNAGAHHLANAAIHASNAALLFLLLRGLTGAVWRSALVAALFAWHPLRVESVAWISERKDVLSGFFFMLTLLAYTRFAKKTDPPTSKSKRWFRLSLFFFALGLLSKPMLVTVPAILLLLDFWPLVRIQSGRLQERLVEKVPFAALSLALSVITFLSQRSGGSVVSLKSLGLLARVEFFFTGCLGYLENFFHPTHLTFLYLRPAEPSNGMAILALILVVGFSAVARVQFLKRPYLMTGWLWFLVMLLPVGGLIQVGLQSMADRYTYLPMIGILILLVWGGHALGTAFTGGPAVAFLTAAGSLALCLHLSRHQLEFWRNSETLMRHALEIDPNNYIAHHNLGIYLSRNGRLEEAQIHRRRALELDPSRASKVEPLNP